MDGSVLIFFVGTAEQSCITNENTDAGLSEIQEPLGGGLPGISSSSLRKIFLFRPRHFPLNILTIPFSKDGLFSARIVFSSFSQVSEDAWKTRLLAAKKNKKSFLG